MSITLAQCLALLGAGAMMGAGGVTIASRAAGKPKVAAVASHKPIRSPHKRNRAARVSDMPTVCLDPVAPSLAPVPLTLPGLNVGNPPAIGWHSGGGSYAGPAGGYVFPNAPVIPPVAAPVVEPAQWAMMLAGFGLIGLAMRRSRLKNCNRVKTRVDA